MGKYGIVFGGGGGKGAYEVGVWEALRKSGYDKRFEIAVGTSVGALNAALFAQGDLEIAKSVWENISDAKLLSPKWFDSINPSFFSQKGLEHIIQSNLNGTRLRNSEVQCYVCAACSDEVESILQERLRFSQILVSRLQATFFHLNKMDDADIEKALLASSAIPGVFGSVVLDEHYYRDGGLIPGYNVPWKKAVELGCTQVFAVDLTVGAFTQYYYKNAMIFHIHPSASLGDMISGTLDFQAANAKRRMQMGYTDVIARAEMLKRFFD